ncbi:MAG TPA: ATP-binding protein, partial [Opitutaceae bacterium]|nr:ATP-binding protein [Opitutaceae bacterium]
QSGAVDAVVVNGTGGSQVYSLAGTDQRFRFYVEQMQEGAITASQDGFVLYCNRRFAEMVEMPLERVIGAPIANHLTVAAWAELSLVFTEGRESVKQDAMLQRADASKLAVQLTASRLPAHDQNILCVVVTDLTQQNLQQDLKLAKDLAEKSNRAKDAFLAALSHELRTPLTPVLMAAVELERNQTLPAHVQRDLAMIRRNIELEARLIDDLLDLTRIASGKLELHTAPLDLHAVVRSAVAICRPELELKDHHFEVHLEAPQTTTTGDAVRLQQALWNLIRNAVKFTPTRGHLTVRTRNTPAPSVCVEVSDSGIGFEPHESDKLFEPFEQGGRDITRQFGGLGLGLAISSSIVKAHGGSLRAESRGQGRGATFTIELPLTPGPLAGGSLPRVADASRSAPAAARLRILLVEDHKDTRATLQRYLQAARNDVTAAGTAAQALEMAANTPFDLVISDLGLPDEGGGLAMMRLLRDRHGLKGIAVSGYGMDADVAQSHAAGFVHHLTKPFNLERLKGLIDGLSAKI